MSKKYQFRYILPDNSAAIKDLSKRTMDKISSNFNNPEGIHLSLSEGLAISIIVGAKCNMNTKLAYEPGKRSPCYALAMCSFEVKDKKILFPYGGEDTLKANMFITNAPELHNIQEQDPEDFFELFGSTFLPEHKKDRYVGTAYERACIILDLYGHMKILNLLNNVIGFGVVEYFDWATRAAGTTQEQYFKELNEVLSTLSAEKHLQPFFEDEEAA
jgi:hypothetical protein